MIGQSLGGLYYGKPYSKDEIVSSMWLSNQVFSSGIYNQDIEVEALEELSFLAVSESSQLLEAAIDKLPSHLQTVCSLALNIPSKYDEACAIFEGSLEKNIFFEKFNNSAEVESWEFEDEQELLDRLTRCLLTTLLKQTGMLHKSPGDPVVKEIFKVVLNYRYKLINKASSSIWKAGEHNICNEKDDDVFENYHKKHISNDQNTEEVNFKHLTQNVIHRCLFLLIFVKGKFILSI